MSKREYAFEKTERPQRKSPLLIYKLFPTAPIIPLTSSTLLTYHPLVLLLQKQPLQLLVVLVQLPHVLSDLGVGGDDFLGLQLLPRRLVLGRHELSYLHHTCCSEDWEGLRRE